MVERPAAVLALDASQVDPDLALQLQVLGLAEVVLQQDELRRDGGVGLQLEHEMPVRLLQGQQGVGGARDQALDGVEGRGLGGELRGVVHQDRLEHFGADGMPPRRSVAPNCLKLQLGRRWQWGLFSSSRVMSP